MAKRVRTKVVKQPAPTKSLDEIRAEESVKRYQETLDAVRQGKDVALEALSSAIVHGPEIADEAIIRRALDAAMQNDAYITYSRILSRYPQLATFLNDPGFQMPPAFAEKLVRFIYAQSGPAYDWVLRTYLNLLSEYPSRAEAERYDFESGLREQAYNLDLSPLALKMARAGLASIAIRAIKIRNDRQPDNKMTLRADETMEFLRLVIRDSVSDFRQALTMVPAEAVDRVGVIQAFLDSPEAHDDLVTYVAPEDAPELLDRADVYVCGSRNPRTIREYAVKMQATRNVDALKNRLARVLCPTPGDMAEEYIRTGRLPDTLGSFLRFGLAVQSHIGPLV